MGRWLGHSGDSQISLQLSRRLWGYDIILCKFIDLSENAFYLLPSYYLSSIVGGILHVEIKISSQAHIMFFLKQLFSSVSFPVASLYLFNQKLLKIKTTNWNPPNLLTVVIFKFMSLNELIWCYIKNDCCRNLSFRRKIFFGNDSSKRRWRCKSPFPYILCVAAGPKESLSCVQDTWLFIFQ